MERVFSGIQPSASQVHLGNYLGAMKEFVRLSKQYQTIVCIVDLHAMTTVHNGENLSKYTQSLMAAYLAVGLDPEQCIIFKQSDVPEVTELAWYLACQFPFGLLERAHTIKDARAKDEQINCGRAFYVLLMAADILLYKATKVPVGEDQRQHIEMTRDAALKFNLTYGEVFPMPDGLIQQSTGVIPGLDGRKMSKSYDNFIGLFDSPKEIKAKVARIVTDSKGLEDKKEPDSCNVYNLYKLFATAEESQAMADKYRAGGYGYGHAKQELVTVLERTLAPVRDSYNSLIDRPDFIKDILNSGGAKAREIAQQTIDEVRSVVGTR